MSGIRTYDYWLPTEDEFIRFRVELSYLIKYYRDQYKSTKDSKYYQIANELARIALILCSPED